MKRAYNSPQMAIELFAANQAIATCIPKDVTFECMIGTMTDTTNVIIEDAGCANKALLAEGVTSAYNPIGGLGHSNGGSGTWNADNTGCTYYAPSGSKGLLVICAVHESDEFTSPIQLYTTASWSQSGNQLVHTSVRHDHALGSKKDLMYHCQVAPVSDITNVTIGS